MIPRRNFIASTLALVGLGHLFKKEKLSPEPPKKHSLFLDENGWKWAEINGKLLRLPVLKFFTTNVISNKEQVFQNSTKKQYGPDFGWEEAYAWLPFERAVARSEAAILGAFENVYFWGPVRVVAFFHPDQELDAIRTQVMIQTIQESKKAVWGDIVA